eukprot:TRINITY_DN609_c0_g1_i1.p1 TRINITY_DN609_c0_g1~~TRINITY_DN609_c0_g1_i1.p1  ORF type:complete len:849 (-),score=251.85 TRINITY_DN609_c0_g1_i1:287-2530(-)
MWTGGRAMNTFRSHVHRGGSSALRMSGLEGDVTGMAALGTDALKFLAATVAIVPIAKRFNLSPVLGFLAAGLILGPKGVGAIKDLRDLNALGELGITFLLFEQGLELSLDRLKALGKYAFGLGTLQVLLCTAAFGAFPFVGGVQLLELVFKSPDALVNISRLDEAVVIGAALSLSSSAFVLKILQEKGLLRGRAGQATLGVLLLQDIAVVPLLVLLPIIENQQRDVPLGLQASMLALTAVKAIGGLAGILVLGRVILRRLFEAVAAARSTETFVALCLLVAIGIGELTDSLGLSSTLGAFIAGTLLAETNYRMQVEADIAPFRGLLLGLFFMTTGASVDPGLLLEQWPTVIGLLGGLLLIKGVITSLVCPLFGLTKGESVRVGSILSGGGEFAFVVLTLAQKLNVLPMTLDKLLVGTVVLSMALTPVLAEAGDRLGAYLDELDEQNGVKSAEEDNPEGVEGRDMVVICGFGPVGQIVGSLISSPTVSNALNNAKFIAFDLNPKRVSESRKKGYPVYYGDGSQPKVIETAGINNPKALVVTYSNHDLAVSAVERLRAAYPLTPIFTRATDYEQYWRLQEEGATAVVSDLSEISIRLGSELLESFGVPRTYDIQAAKVELRQTLARLSQAGGIKREFSAKFSAEQLAPSNFVASGLIPARVIEEAGVQVTQGVSSLHLEDITEEDLGVTVCLLPDWSVQDDGYSEADLDGAAVGEMGRIEIGEIVDIVGQTEQEPAAAAAAAGAAPLVD